MKPPERTCGDCRACCTSLRVEGIKGPEKVYTKTEGEPCEYLATAPESPPCLIYADRPKACREWSCEWLKGVLAKDDPSRAHLYRPDRLGVIFDARTPLPGNPPTFMVHEVWKDAALHPAIADMLSELEKSAIVMVSYFDGRKGVSGPGIRAEITPAPIKPFRHFRVIQ